MFKKLFLSALLSLCTFTLVEVTEASAVEYAVPTSGDVKVYDNRTGALVQIATMKYNQPLVINSDFGANWWQVKLGNGYGYVSKHETYKSSTWTTQNVNNGQSNSNTTVVTQVDTIVYDSSDGNLYPMGVINKGYRYPVIADFGTNWWKVDFGGRVGYICKCNVGMDTGVPVLMYHHILTPTEKANSGFANANTTVTTTEFNSQMQYLKDQGFTTIRIADLEKYMNRTVNLPAKTVVITFDDGIVSTREYAYPVLKKHGFVAEQFIITSRIGATQAFDWKGLQFFSQSDMNNMSDVFGYGNHTHALHNVVNGVSDVVSKPNSVVYADFKTARDILKTNYFAYPFGQYNSTTISNLKSLGFTMAVTTKSGRVNLGEDKMQIERLGIEPGVTLNQFANKVN